VTFLRSRLVAVAGVVVAVAAVGSAVALNATASDRDSQGFDSLQVRLTGYQETPAALSTTGAGTFRARIDERRQEISYRLSYESLEAGITQAHIHLGIRAQTGAISVFLCSNLGNGPVGTQACPVGAATVTGVLRPADVIGPAAQGIAAGEFAELVRAIRAGSTYVNVHSTLYPAGEIRAQLDHQH
jgi:hypothetical protein